MTDTDNSDDERYANESFDNESDTEVPEMTEFESVSTENSDDDNGTSSSVKINTGPIKRNSYPSNFITVTKTDAIPYDSSSEEEDEVIVGQTLAEINTPSMFFDNEPPASAVCLSSVDEETKESSEEISEEEDDDDDEELNRIKDMEQKYLQQRSAKARDTNIKSTESPEDKEQTKAEESLEDESENDSEEEEDGKEKQEYVSAEENLQENSCDDRSLKASCSSGSQELRKDNEKESIDQIKLVQVIQSSLMSINVSSINDKKDNLLEVCQTSVMNEIKTQSVGTIDAETIAMAVVQALKSVGLKNFEVNDPAKALETSEEVMKEIEENDTDAKKRENGAGNDNKIDSSEENESQVVPYGDDHEKESNVDMEKIQNNDNYDDDHYIYYDGRITSKTPTSFNSDDYIFHANFIKQFHRTNSIDKLRAKPHPRKSMSFSNERMREIERHNQILLRKILTQKPTYTLKSKSSQSSLEKQSSQTNTRLTTSAVNRKKQQRQIDLDNQVLKRKIEAIALRRRPFIT